MLMHPSSLAGALRHCGWFLVFQGLLFSFTDSNYSTAQDEAVEEVGEGADTIQVLAAAVDQWERTISFVARFEVRGREFATLSEAQDDPVEAWPVLGTGLLAKRGHEMRLQSSGGIYQDRGFDEATNQVLTLTYREGVADRRILGSAHINEREHDIRNRMFPGQESVAFVTPLAPLGTNEAGAFELWDLATTGALPMPQRIEVLNVSENEIRIVQEHADSDVPRTQRREVTVRTDFEFPAVTAISHYVTTDNGTSEYHASLSDFTNCSGGMVASTVTSTAVFRRGGVRCRAWIAQELAAREPTDEELAVFLPHGTTVFGLKNRPDPSSEHRLYLGQFSSDDLGRRVLEENDNADNPYDFEPDAVIASRGRWFVLVNAVAVALVAAVWFAWRRRGARP